MSDSKYTEERAFGNWLMGFTDGEGCFTLSEVITGSGRLNGTAAFQICLRRDDAHVLKIIKTRLMCGKLCETKRVAIFGVYNLDDLVGTIIPFFDEYRLRAKKSKDFDVWKQGVILLHSIKHRTGRIKWTASDNKIFSDIVKKLSEVREYQEPDTSFVNWKDTESCYKDFANWLVGFTDGEGCFDLRSYIQKGGWWRGQASFRIRVRYDDLPVLLKIENFLGYGRTRWVKGTNNNKPAALFLIPGSCNLAECVVPFFDDYSLRSKKSRDFQIWRQGVQLLHSVTRRKVKSRGCAKGWEFKWSKEEISRLDELAFNIKEIRKYDGNQA